ncbi:4-hydroxy-tetrahydrodipicolinate reductase [Limibaculum sp. FT325]|uniref:4-hydroxy-tetrahydrodipicolinate reductase n=1 Tax=Thermohalobaculum sediminis TaxID=2939436 RepID=UPI0020BD991D|nr:4-hydroxy-tetrahydrodipicolinate reductase [Limibaculum sediminis]MCL5776702.1 4-hydroxy-tetrahydrodipicolinate reductase [Limibaculum sediminis]
MTDARPIDITVTGAAGRMGRMLAQAVRENPACRLVGATERPGHPWIGRDLGEAMEGPAIGVMVEDDPLPVFARSRAVLDFTSPAATVAHAALAAQARLVHVIGTTGLEADHLDRIEAAARHSTVIRAGNFSLGVNLLTVLARRVAAALGEEFDIEILEMHHRHKVDAPSGTALMLGEAAAEGRGTTLAEARLAAREGITGARPAGGIGFAALRGGDVVGEHEILFAGPGERVALRHVATDRMLFARGAVRAAIWGAGQKPGEYGMTDVLGLA